MKLKSNLQVLVVLSANDDGQEAIAELECSIFLLNGRMWSSLRLCVQVMLPIKRKKK